VFFVWPGRSGRNASASCLRCGPARLLHFAEPTPDNRLFVLAMIYHAMGQRLDEAFTWMGKAYARRSVMMIYLKCLPEVPAFTHDPRYETLLQKMNLPEQ
jgi:hypothetical protein